MEAGHQSRECLSSLTKWPENTKNSYLDPQMQLCFTNLASTHVFIPDHAEQGVDVHLPEQRPSFQPFQPFQELNRFEIISSEIA